MPELVVPQPPLIDQVGNINVHGREGISVPIKRWSGDPSDPSQTEIDISGDTLTFEVDGLTPIPLVPDPNDAKGQLLVIESLAGAGILVTPGNYPRFVLRDTTGAIPIVRWEGQFIVRGWE